MPVLPIQLQACDPGCSDALALLRLAAIEARALYPESAGGSNAPAPTHAPLPPKGVYLVAYVEGKAAGMGAHYPLDAHTTEIRRMYVAEPFRRHGVARQLLLALEQHARQAGFAALRLETGFRQTAALRLYESCGFKRIPPFGRYAGDPTSVCFEKFFLRPSKPALPRPEETKWKGSTAASPTGISDGG